MPRRLWLVLSAAVGSTLCAASCGSRTELPPGEEPCAALGDVRPCQNSCGSGEQRCEGGVWQTCVVASAARPCEGVCGAGVQTCEDGRWLECEVQPTTRPCTDACGSGIQTCRNDAWQACEVPPVAMECESVCGKGEIICSAGAWHPCNAPQPKPPTLVSIVRDFRDSHPDFELPIIGDRLEQGLVLFDLGPDDKPVYANRPGSVTTSGAGNFDQWFRDVPMINISTSVDLVLSPSPDQPGFFGYSNDAFFPIDDELFGNEGRRHNFHFTLEASTRFEYRGGRDLQLQRRRRHVGVHQSTPRHRPRRDPQFALGHRRSRSFSAEPRPRTRRDLPAPLLLRRAPHLRVALHDQHVHFRTGLLRLTSYLG